MDRSVLETSRATQGHSLELAARTVDRLQAYDSSARMLVETLGVGPQTGATVSGLTDNDYPSLGALPAALSGVNQIKTLSRVPLPAEILERFGHMQCHTMMGLFTEINRAWLTLDSDIYVWTYEDAEDVAYYDGLNDNILCVGLVAPRPGVFHSFIKYLLVLTTASDIVVLGVTFKDDLQEIALVPDPVFTIPTDGSIVTTVAGTADGRLFLGSKEGCLYELSYQAESGWFGKRCKKLNHSTSTLSFLVPSFVNAALSEEDAIVQISIDDSRHILYALTEKGGILVYDLGERGDSLSKVTKVSQAYLVQQAMNTVSTLDSQTFRPIVNISAVEASESGHINLVAIAQTGVRFYLTVVGLANLQPNQRPYTLTLVHVRLPPGYSAIMATRPRQVHMGSFRQSTCTFLSNVNEKDVLWCLSSDLFPFNPMLMEMYTTMQLDGPARAVSEVRNSQDGFQTQPAPPLVVRQHSEPPRKYVVLTAQGAHVFLKLRPVDVLRQLLVDCHGPDNDAVRSFFMIQKEDQACATALILACLESLQNVEVAEWATRAFFLYGGEPTLLQHQHNLNQTYLRSTFLPTTVSTPLPSHLQQKQQIQPTPTAQFDQSVYPGNPSFVFSARHNGLYLYLARILRPIWNSPCVEKLTVDKKTFLASTVSGDECSWIMSYLNSLRVFLQKNTHLQTDHSQTLLNTTEQEIKALQEAQVEERHSLESFKSFVTHCCQTLGLWRILCEHQFHGLVDGLPQNYHQMLQNTSFKDLLLYGQDLCMVFINGLINTYLADSASIDSISAKLREVCPSLYKNEDAICSKIYEVLKHCKTLHSVDEKEELISSALELAQSVAPNLNLHEVCQQFADLQAYRAVIQLCVAFVKKIDPENVAEYYYNNGQQPGSDQLDSYNYYTRRMKVYKEILNILDDLSEQTRATNTNTSIQPESADRNKIQLFHQLISTILQYHDELLHVALYEWMVGKQMDAELLRIAQPSLEKYLSRTAQHGQENIGCLELLWKYYESSANHASAARILHGLAGRPGNSLTLKDRVQYLTRAVMCMRNDKVGYAPHMGVFLRDLEDKLEMARVQEEVLDCVANLRTPHGEEAVSTLNSGLFDLTQLYEEFADPFNLWECKLAIINSAGYLDAGLIKQIWQHIIEKEVKNAGGMGNDKLTQIMTKISSLLRQYKNSPNILQLEFILKELEVLSVKYRANPSIIPSAIAAIIPMHEAVEVYNSVVCTLSSDIFWSLAENEFHLAESFAELVGKFLSNTSCYDYHMRVKIRAACEDTVAKLLSSLYSKSNADHLIALLRNIQNELSRL